MIGLGSQYLTAAGFGRYKITAASLGNLDLLGTLGWLRYATMQAILGAFGATDGMAVIKATNAYLNGIAATDRDKATALAGFINEDPMMVCSLPLTISITMPSRYAIVPRGAYIKSGINMTWGVGIEGKVETDDATGELWGTGNHTPTYMTAWCIAGNNWRYMGSPISGPSWCPTSAPVVVRQDSTGLYFNGNKHGGSYSDTIGGTGDEIWLCGHDSFMKGKSHYWKMYDLNGQLRYFVPCKHNNEAGFLDILNVVWYGNSGSGSFTIHDISYTPSTP